VGTPESSRNPRAFNILMIARSLAFANPSPSRNFYVKRGGDWAVFMALRIAGTFLKDVR
jgi:hypothetical protein